MFWVGIGHAGTLISAILYLFRAGFRTTIYRCAEAMTVFAVMTAGLFPILHLGPPVEVLLADRVSELAVDLAAVQEPAGVGRVRDPDLSDDLGDLPVHRAPAGHRGRCATARRIRFRKKIFGALSLGWRNSDREWRHFARAYLFLAAFATPLVLSVHSVVSFDFAMANVPGWHATIFPPYFVAGAIFSGMGMVFTIIIPLRKFFKLKHYVTLNDLDAAREALPLHVDGRRAARI